ncbi:hypothetical protein [Pseudomonas sp. FP1740]|uniref:hypothetical protein n=1 Tax=Pseudomonas sp. FP1740 TaxID=2954078 RepID=UPI00273290C6|nr:hypothetical protein [Pseudomonas sp. FP1740]WLG42749.1 hypothetical protein PSH69_17830 [Pseudomonas sp. FP1740]
MIDNQETDIELLELYLLDGGMSINEMVRHYARFLLELIQKGRLKNISDEKLQGMTSYLTQALALKTLESNEGLRKASFAQLWPIEKEYRESDPAFSAFVRCVICCFGNEDDWEQDDSGEETPLWFFLFYIKKVYPDVGPEFFEYFRRAGNSAAGGD